MINLAVIKVTLRMMIVIVGGADTLLTMLSHGGHLRPQLTAQLSAKNQRIIIPITNSCLRHASAILRRVMFLWWFFEKIVSVLQIQVS